MKRVVLFVIGFYQKYLTILSFGSCRYHPTCSTYAKMQFEHNNFFKAFFCSILRILRCNPLFDGGFDYVKVKSPVKTSINLEFKKIKVKYWLVPVNKNQCFILQHNTKWDK